MINHTRTLLLNKLAIDCTGYPYNEYIDPNFVPVNLTRELQQVYSAIYGIVNISAQLNTVMGLLKILHIDLLEPFTLYFDHRITYNVRKLSVLDTTNSQIIINTIQLNIEQRLLDFNVLNAIFKPTGGSDIQSVYNIWSQTQEAVIKLGAVLLAYTYQLENMRK
jgi:hypothetical protein